MKITIKLVVLVKIKIVIYVLKKGKFVQIVQITLFYRVKVANNNVTREIMQIRIKFVLHVPFKIV